MSIAARFAAAFTSALALIVAAPALAAFGDVDCSFGVGGVQKIESAFGTLFNAVEDPRGGAVYRFGGLSSSSLFYRANAQGSTDTYLGLMVNGEVLDPGEVVHVDGGVLTSNGHGTIAGVERYFLNGRDTAFGLNGIATHSRLRHAATRPVVLPDGRILVAGRLDEPSGTAIAGVVRFNADGSVDTSFGSAGAATNASAGDTYSSMDLQADGRIVLASRNNRLWRLEANGQLDPTFGVAGSVDLAGVFPALSKLWVRVQPSAKILVGGMLFTIRIARFDSAGALDTSVAGGMGYRDVSAPAGVLFGRYSPHTPFWMMADGRPLFTGTTTFEPSGFSSTGAIVRYTVDLADDASAVVPFVPSFALQLSSGRLLVGKWQSVEVRRLLGDAESQTCLTTTTTLTSAPNPSRFGQGVTLMATVTASSGPAPTGSVQFLSHGIGVGLSTLGNGVATFSISSLHDGDSLLTAVYSGSGAALGSTSATHTHTVTPRLPTTIVLSSDPNPSAAGQPVTLTATVGGPTGSGTPVGSVYFMDGLTPLSSLVPLSSGTATLVTSAIPDGTRNLTAQYMGDAIHAPSISAPVSHVVPSRLTVDDPGVNAAFGPGTLNFTVTLSTPSASTVTVNYATADRTATAGVHYTATSGTLTFTPGQTSKVVGVPVAQSQPGLSKELFLALGSPSNATLAKGAGIGYIAYYDPNTLAIFIDDPMVVEGPGGTTLLGFNLTLSRASSSPVTVQFATADGTGAAGTDYVAQSGTVTFPRDVMQRWVMVPVIGNTTVQSNRTFFVTLSSPNQGTLGKAQGTGTIIDDDPTPPATTVPQYRLYSNVTKEHLYTTDANEYAILGTANWVQEGIAYTMFSNPGTYGGQHAIPLYRLYHPGIRQHHWTTDANEVATLVMTYGTWQYERIPGYLLPNAAAGTIPLYRLNLPNPPLHLWTTDLNEKNVLTAQHGWFYEGEIGEVLP